ncbi:MAG: ubiquinone/menaquinone biosynthesis methyltransferase [Vicinamibacterales bacterium]
MHSPAPLPTPLAEAFASPVIKRRYVRQLFSTIAARYDLITRLLSFGLDQRWKRKLVAAARIHATTRVLDLACGTGDLALLALARGGRVTGLDLAAPMIALARKKPGGSAVRWLVGDMGMLPFATGSVDVVTTGYGLRNVPDLQDALLEIHRVLIATGVVCSLDFNRPESRLVRSVYLGYLTMVGSALGWILHGDPNTYRYIAASLRRYPGAAGVATLMRGAGFSEVRVVPLLGGLMTLHVGSKGVVPGRPEHFIQ